MKTNRKMMLALSIVTVVAHASAWAHASLERAVPGKNAVLTAAPKEVNLRFNEQLENSFSLIKVLDTDGKNVLEGKAKVDPADPKTLRVPLEPLKPGKYKVQWVGVGHDGHRRAGDYLFSVK
jgi:methionine-rich copper-binding protein CopC